MNENATLGFIGLGVMGEPMCSNLIRKSGRQVHLYDLEPNQVLKLTELGGVAQTSIANLSARAEIVFLSLPSIVEVEDVAEALIAAPNKPRMVVDMSTSDVARTRVLAERLNQNGIGFVDAPVARMRKAAHDGTLLIAVGGTDAQFEQVLPLLLNMGSDVIHCGGIGSGQVVKIINNMLVFMNVNALAEAITIGRRAGVDGEQLFSALTMGSADSFALRNPGLKALVPDEFPEKAFPTDYAIKDIRLALELANSSDYEPEAARHTYELLCRTRDAGFSKNYYPAMVHLIDGRQ